MNVTNWGANTIVMLIDMTNNEKADSLASGAANRLFRDSQNPARLDGLRGAEISRD